MRRLCGRHQYRSAGQRPQFSQPVQPSHRRHSLRSLLTRRVALISMTLSPTDRLALSAGAFPQTSSVAAGRCPCHADLAEFCLNRARITPLVTFAGQSADMSAARHRDPVGPADVLVFLAGAWRYQNCFAVRSLGAVSAVSSIFTCRIPQSSARQHIHSAHIIKQAPESARLR